MNKTINGKKIYNVSEEGLGNLGLSEQEIDAIKKELAWEPVVNKRNLLLESTDWTQVSDAQLSDEKKQEFAAYRQALRDIPQTYSNPEDVVWPVKPTV